MHVNRIERKFARDSVVYISLIRDFLDAGIIAEDDAIKLLSGNFDTYTGRLPRPKNNDDESTVST
jgi:hypothetical protein